MYTFSYIYIFFFFLNICIYIYIFFDLWAFCSKNKYSMKGELPKSLFVNTYIRFQIFSRFSDCFILMRYLQNIKINRKNTLKIN